MKFPWKWIVFGLIILFTILAIAYGGTGHKMVRDWIVADQIGIQTELENEVSRLNRERDQYIRQVAQLKQEKAHLNQQYKILEGRYANLENQFANIIVPTNPNDLVLAFRRGGFSSATRTSDGRICFTTK